MWQLGAGIVDRIARRECMLLLLLCSVLAELVSRSSHGVISDEISHSS
jgi:hypothetical protein